MGGTSRLWFLRKQSLSLLTLELQSKVPLQQFHMDLWTFMGEKKETGAFCCGRVNVGESGGLEKDKQRDMEKVQRWGRVKDSQPIPWPGSPGGAVVPGKAGLSLGSQTGSPPGSSHVILIAPHLAPSSYEWNPPPRPLEASWTKELRCRKWTPPCKIL